MAAAIYAEHSLNVDWKDHLTDVPGGYAGFNTSIGVSQVQVETAKLLEEKGYMPKIIRVDDGLTYLETGSIYDTETMMRVNSLRDPKTNIRYAAAYLKNFQDNWASEYPVIAGDSAVLTTLFNQGQLNPPHPNPTPNDFGRFAAKYYSHVCGLLGL
ncbi:hypothetical protein LJC10_05695 [Selenomonadales bacterium OttesenSCG-928-I06]|nr:hypothetical protein [Selenomonadales bacterium OttesenSCG-928-I06]